MKYKSRLTLVGKSSTRHKDGTYLHEYVCSCGKSTVKLKRYVDKGTTSSCGCLKSEVTSARSKGLSAANRLPDPTTNACNAVMSGYKSSAKHKGHCFKLSTKEFREITSSDCHYCEKVPSQYRKPKGAREGYFFNGIDRKDNSKGYTAENCVPCCKECNFTKGPYLSYEEMVLVSNHRKNKLRIAAA